MKRRRLFRLIWILLAVWFVLLGILYFTGNKYRDHALSLLKSQLDERLNTEIIIRKDDIRFSLFKNFPNASLQLNNVLIKSAPELQRQQFAYSGSDTLLFSRELSLVFNLRSFFSQTFEVKGVRVKDARLNILYDKSGHRNFDIFIKKDSVARDSTAFSLREIQLRDTRVVFIDLDAEVHIESNVKKSGFSGDFYTGGFSIASSSEISSFSLRVEDEQYISNEPVNAELGIKKQQNVLSFEEGEFEAFGIKTFANGFYQTDTKNYNFQVKARESSFADIDYQTFTEVMNKAKLKAERGKLDADLEIEGTAGKGRANIAVTWRLREGVIKTIEKGYKISPVYTYGHYQLHNGISSLKIDSLYLRSDESELTGKFSVKNLNRPDFQLACRGRVELQKLMEIEAIHKRLSLDGMVEGYINISGRLPGTKNLSFSAIQNLKMAGRLKVADGNVVSRVNNLPAARVEGTLSMHNKREIILENVALKTGESDLLINGKVMHLPLFTGDPTIFPSYHCNVTSNNLRVDDLLVEAPKEDATKEKMVQLPDSLRIVASIKVARFSFGKFTATSVNGDVIYNPKTLTVHNFSMQSQGGSMHSEITLQQRNQKISADIDATIDQVDIGDMFLAFNNFRQDVIVAENIDGILSGQANVHASWDLYLNPFMNELDVSSNLVIRTGELINYQPMLGLSRFIEVDELRHIKFDRLETSVRIKDETVSIPQTAINSTALSMTASGQHGFDNSYSYRTQIQLSDVLWRKARKKKPENTEFGYIVDDGLGRTTLPLIIEGKGTEFEVKYDKKTAGSTFREKMEEEGQTWRELMGKEDKDRKKEKEEDNMRIEWEEDQGETTKDTKVGADKENNTDHNEKEEEEKPEFRIEWDDE